MARMCEVCGKKPQSGNRISHAHNKTRRRWLPNLQKVNIIVNGAKRNVRMCTRCIRTGDFVKAI